MKIGELSRRTGVSVRALRYYDEQGLLQPQRRPSGYREFTANDVAVVARIQTLISAGLNTELIAQVLHCFDDDGAGHVPTPTCAEMVTQLSAARARMLARIDDLTTSAELLAAIIAAAPTGEDSSVETSRRRVSSATGRAWPATAAADAAAGISRRRSPASSR
ncbi:MerR family transcriptional regulator [Prauserella endophytica]|uniref:MerR family transcriptional regulator n=1 Tax=Prauserella endophytica TaxID=1592324 RepID=A0ABY2S8Q5_9PSEU|nr:MerR family transcriptional regulator [Prauserella endophytica]TKG71684.1 MerR family transcriptional regulator [Prauserella endophytica]